LTEQAKKNIEFAIICFIVLGFYLTLQPTHKL
jgi:hypothetical protein